MKNKKRGQRLLLGCLLGIFAVSSGYGQAGLIVLIVGDKVATEKFYLSIDGALNISSLPGLHDHEILVGVHYGLGMHIRLNEKWYLKPEFKPLSRKGATNIDPITLVNGEFTLDKTKIKMNYIDVPILVQYNITPKLYVSAGPEISFVTDAYQFLFGTQTDGFETTIKVDTKSFFNKTSFSFPVEAGYTLILATKRSTSTMKLNVFARYEHGFTEIFKDTSVGSSKISLFQFGLSLPFIKSPEELAKAKK